MQAFAEPALVAAVAAEGGFWGWTGRTADHARPVRRPAAPRGAGAHAPRRCFANAVFTRYTREFARTWNGTGVDTDLVDAEALRENWLSPTPHAPSMTLLQQAWLAARTR